MAKYYLNGEWYPMGEQTQVEPTNMDNIFSNTTMNGVVTHLNIFNTANVTSMLGVFSGASFITGLDLSTWDTSRVTSMRSMFENMSSLEWLDISQFTFDGMSGVVPARYMFRGINTNAEIYVKGTSESDYINTNTNIPKGVKIYIGKRGAAGTYLHRTT